MARWTRDHPGPLGGPAPSWPGPLDRLADRWAGASARTRLVIGVLGATIAVAPSLADEPEVVAVTARVDLAVGTRLDHDLLEAGRGPAASLPPDTFPDVAELTGRVIRHPVAAGQPVLARDVVDGIDAMVAPGRVAVALPAELVPALEPGQRLDVVGADAMGVPRVLAADAVVLQVDDDGVWVEVEREASAALGHAVAWGGLTVAVLPVEPDAPTGPDHGSDAATP